MRAFPPPGSAVRRCAPSFSAAAYEAGRFGVHRGVRMHPSGAFPRRSTCTQASRWRASNRGRQSMGWISGRGEGRMSWSALFEVLALAPAVGGPEWERGGHMPGRRSRVSGVNSCRGHTLPVCHGVHPALPSVRAFWSLAPSVPACRSTTRRIAGTRPMVCLSLECSESPLHGPSQEPVV